MKNIISILLIVLSIALVIFYIRPEYGNMNNLRAEKAQFDDALSKAKQLKSVRDSLLTTYNQISDTDLAKLKRLVPETFDPVALTADVSATAANYGMSVKQAKVEQQADSASRSDVVTADTNNPYTTNTMSFLTSGQYPSFIALLKDIESNIDLVDVKKLTISQSRVSTGQLDFEVFVDTYSLQ